MSKLKLKTKPYPHQIKAVKRALKQGSHAFYFEPRLGKTKAVLDAIAVQHYRGEVQRVAVIAPLIALDVWVSQIAEHLSVPAKVTVLDEPPIFFYPTTRSSKRDRLKLEFRLTNYDKFSRRGETAAYRNKYLRDLERWAPDLLVLDESHRCKRAGAVRSQALWRMARRLRSRPGSNGLPHVYLLSGTPSPKGYIDLFSQYRILDESIFGTNKADFEEEYCVFGHGNWKYTVVKYRHKEKLLKKMRARATIVNAEEAGLAGVQFFNPLRIDLPPKVRSLYDRFAESLVEEIQGEVIEAPNAAVRRLRLLQITGGYTTSGKQIHRAKLTATADYLEDLLEQGESVVVYARFIPEVLALGDLVSRVGFESSVIYGKTPRRARTEAISRFQRSRKPGALVFQNEAGALAIELTRAADVFYYSLPDGWETFKQTQDRVMGPKQKRPVRYTYLLAKGTVDVSVLAALRNKRDMHAEMMRHPRGFLFGL